MRVDLPVPAAVASAWLADPVNRPAWQSSLRGVRILDPGPPRVGQRWLDVTVPGLRPAMETTCWEPGVRWRERGRWRGFTAEVTLDFADTSRGCTVTVAAEVSGPVPLMGRPLAAVGLLTARNDLRRAGRILAGQR